MYEFARQGVKYEIEELDTLSELINGTKISNFGIGHIVSNVLTIQSFCVKLKPEVINIGSPMVCDVI
jgi:hypothetical protein